MKDGSYAYNPADGTYTFTTGALTRLLYRVGAPKEKLEEEDARENAKRILMTHRSKP